MAWEIIVMWPFCAVGIRIWMLNYILLVKMFRQLNGLVDPREVPSQLAGPGGRKSKLTFLWGKTYIWRRLKADEVRLWSYLYDVIFYLTKWRHSWHNGVRVRHDLGKIMVLLIWRHILRRHCLSQFKYILHVTIK